jgi:hypothetical protein
LLVGGDQEHAKGLPAELPLMQIGALGCSVGEELSLQAGLLEVGAIDWHGAAITLNEKGAEPAIVHRQGPRIVTA